MRLDLARAACACILLGTPTSPTRADERPAPGDKTADLGAPADGAWRLSAAQLLGGGFDSNPTLVPATRRTDTNTTTDAELGESALLASETELGAYVGSSWWTGTSLRLDAHGYLDGGNGARGKARLDSSFGLHGGWSGRRFATALVAEGGRYVASFASDNAWRTGLTLRGVLDLGLAWRLGAEIGGALRAYDDGDQRDRSVRGGADVTYDPGSWHVTLGVDADRRESNVPTAIRTELGPRLGVGLRVGAFELDADYFLLGRVFDEPGQDGVESIGRVTGTLWVLPWLGPFVRVEGGIARGQAGSLEYERWAALAGLRARLSAPRHEPPDRRAQLRTQGLATLEDERVRFRVRVPGAKTVAVIATFNGWDERAGRLTPAGNDVFEGAFDIAPGRHRYHLLVDGVAARPPGAAAYAPDGFGGEDAVLIIPEHPR